MCRNGSLKEAARALQSIQDTRLRTKLLSSRDSEGRTSLHIASMKGHRKVVDMLLRENADPRLVDFKGRTAFALARGKPVIGAFQTYKNEQPSLWDSWRDTGVTDAAADASERRREKRREKKKRAKLRKKLMKEKKESREDKGELIIDTM